MSTIETTPQTQKTYKKYSQDHGDAAQQEGHLKDTWYAEMQRSAFAKNDREKFNADLVEADTDYKSMSPAELEAWTDQLLGDAYDQGDYSFYETSTGKGEHATANEVSAEDEVLDRLDRRDGFATEADLGVKSKHEIAKEMGRRVMLDPDFDDDDNGDSDYDSAVRIKNRL